MPLEENSWQFLWMITTRYYVWISKGLVIGAGFSMVTYSSSAARGDKRLHIASGEGGSGGTNGSIGRTFYMTWILCQWYVFKKILRTAEKGGMMPFFSCWNGIFNTMSNAGNKWTIWSPNLNNSTQIYAYSVFVIQYSVPCSLVLSPFARSRSPVSSHGLRGHFLPRLLASLPRLPSGFTVKLQWSFFYIVRLLYVNFHRHNSLQYTSYNWVQRQMSH